MGLTVTTGKYIILIRKNKTAVFNRGIIFPNYCIMEEKNTKEFYLTYILLVTGFSFLLFSLLLNIAGVENTELFLCIGLIVFVLGLLTGCYVLVSRASRRNKSNLIE